MKPERNFDIAIVEKGALEFEDLLQISIKEVMVDKETLAKAIAPVIGQLLDRDFEKLLQLCYRLDLGEDKLNGILLETPPGKITESLSLAIVERQLLKVYYRKTYFKR
ncbi:MAG: hypothetical protein WDZ72_02270 [Cyclobacteriaceae bacterium]